jgi:cation transport ATPase
MKNIKFILIACFFMLFTNLQAQEVQKSKYEKVSVQTSAVCGQCKERLEKNMAFEKGVKSVSLDDETKVLTIEYRIGKTDKEKLKKAITKIGYDADDLPADQKAHDKLPACCQKGNEPH